MRTQSRLKKQVEAAEALVKKINGSNTSEEALVGDRSEQGNTEVTQKTKPVDTQTSEVSGTVEEPQDLSEPSQTFEPSGEVNWQQRAEAAEQRYKVLQGKYNKEIVESRSQPNADKVEVMQLKDEIAELKRNIEEKQKAEQQRQISTAQEQATPNSERLQNLRDDYGNELVDGILAEMSVISQQTAQQAAKQFEQTVDSFKQDSFATKKSMVSQLLAAQRINFDQVNNDPIFHDWLSKYDMDTGIQRQKKLTSQFESGDIHAVTKMFLEFVNGGTQSQAQPVDFTQHVQQPTHAPHLLAETQNTRAVYTPQMIADFYSRKRKGQYTKEEAQRIEREIFSSMKR